MVGDQAAPDAALSSSEQAVGTDSVLIETELGLIEIEVMTQRAPVTSQNFLNYVDGGWYNSGQFHRTVRLDNQPNDQVRIEVVQAGINPDRGEEQQTPIPLERTSVTGLSHRHGTVSMARRAPDSATSGFFVCINDQPELDFGGRRNPDGQGFAAFGRVVHGMEVVLRIQAGPAQGQALSPPIAIRRAERLRH